eukprot:2304207-Pleurochrysis_carterae.AAC.1
MSVRRKSGLQGQLILAQCPHRAAIESESEGQSHRRSFELFRPPRMQIEVRAAKGHQKYKAVGDGLG